MAQPSLIIRADASHRMGIGHVMRCLAIAQAWCDQGGRVTFLSAELPEELGKRLEMEGCQIENLDGVAGTLADASQTISTAQQQNASAIIVDGYQFDVTYHETLTKGGAVTLAIDDFGHLPHYATDLVLNQNLGADEQMYASRGAETELLLGTGYALLRREFFRSHEQLRVLKPAAHRMLVTLGGSDPKNVTETVIEGLKLVASDDLEVRVIVGGLNQHFVQLTRQVEEEPRFALLRDVQDMAAQYEWADLAIAAGGSSNWEMCYFGLPRIVLVIADNQLAIAAELQRADIAINLGEAKSVSSGKVLHTVELLIQDLVRIRRMRQCALALVDGQGGARSVSKLLERSAGRVASGRSVVAP